MQLNKIKLVHAEIPAGSVCPDPKVLQRVVLRRLINSAPHLGADHDRQVWILRLKTAD